ncbi:MAG: DtxR family transcriptional regulator, Mn-dependent transcriptional regulator [Candidatus Eremiobacteraeota bacterium]|jgi:DtxR family Mn-dependent transcriptional regulator|nr:DtxR family transcriptional regulator, Mn-dependent transcriptional regulator [Candidatus Eremiobacteraeota bacterium]
MAGHTHFEESTEEYLEAVYRLEREGPGVSTSGLAADLGVAPASVSGMLKKLGADGYLSYEARGQAKLTEKGLTVAVRVMRRNRLAEVFLHDMLGMPWDQVHEEACRLEHAISERVEERLVAVLGNPQFCPHGLPIPSADLITPPRVATRLADAPVGNSVRVVEVGEDIPETLRYLARIGLRPGAVVEVVERGPMGGPVTVQGPAGRHAISLELARSIAIVPGASSARSA